MNKHITLCKPGRVPVCVLNGVDINTVNYTQKFNDLDEITFTVDKYIETENGDRIFSNGYEKLHAFMEIYVDDIGYFQIKEPEISNEINKETKTVTGVSIATELLQKDLVGFTVNTSTTSSLEMLADNNINSLGYPNEYITFYNPTNKQLSLLDLVLEKAVGWNVGEVDDFLKNQRYSFDNINENIFSFLTKTLSSTARCIFKFDTMNKTVSAYSENHIGNDTGIVIAERNLLNSVDIQCDSDNIYTRLNVHGKDSLNFADINYGDTHIFNLDYYSNLDYMSQDLIDALGVWQNARSDGRDEYISKVKTYQSYLEQISEIDNKVPTNGVLNNWDNMSMDELNKNLTYYNSLIKELQIVAQNTHPKAGETEYVGSLDDYSPSRLKSDGTVDHDSYMNDLDGQGKETYREVITYVIPNIEIAIENFGLTKDDKKDYFEDYLTDWDLYGLVELKAKQSSYEDQIGTLKAYQKGWSELTEEEKASHGDNEATYTQYHEEYEKLDGYLTAIKNKATELQDKKDKLVSSRDTLSKELSTIRSNMSIDGGRYVDGSFVKWFTEEQLSTINLLFHDTDYTNENILITKLNDFSSKLDIEKELYADAEKELSELSVPQYTFNCSLDNLLSMDEFSFWHNDFEVGNFITLEINKGSFSSYKIDGIFIKLRLISISYNPFIKTNDLTVEFSNMITGKDGRNDFSYIFDKTISAAKNSITLSNNNNAKDDIELSIELLNLLSNSSVFQGKFDNLNLKSAVINEAAVVKLTADFAKITELDAKYATIENLSATNATITELNANVANIEKAYIKKIEADEIYAKTVEVNTLLAGYVKSDVASIGTLFNKVGLIDRATIVDGHITGFLDAVEINANNITAGTLVADRILLKAPEGSDEEGLLYAINNLGELESASVDTIDGYVLTPRTISADKIIAESITTNELDVANIFGNTAVLNTLVSQDIFTNAISANDVVVGASLDASSALGIATNAKEIAEEANKNAGKSINGITIYYLATSLSENVTTSTKGWTSTPQTMTSQNKYLWTYQKMTNADGNSTDTTPTISGVYGDKGEKGDDGKTPVKGVDYFDGTSSYLWIRYATDANGSGMTATPSSKTKYIGTASTTTSTAPTSASSYKWSKYVGTDGTKGANGYVHIAYANSSDGSTDFDTSIGTDKKYIGQYTDNTETDSTDYTKYTWTKIKGDDGKDGTSITIKSTSVTYQTSSNGTTVPTSDWSATVPSVSNGQYLWTRTIVNYSDGKSTTSYSVAYKGTNGTNGTSSYTHIRYSVTSNGNPMVTTPTDSTLYIGIYTGTSSTAPTSYTSYTWSRYTGKDGTNGTNGKDGNGINSISYFYAVTSTQNAPSASNITSTTIPTLSPTNKYLWQKEVIDFTDSSVADKTSVILLAVYGDKGETGISVSSAVTLYYASNSATAPSAPTAAISATGTLYNTWVITQPTLNKSYPYIYVCTQVKYSNNTYSWSTVTIERSLSQIAKWCHANDITLIDGAKIYAGSITAEKIKAGSLTIESFGNSAINTIKMYSTNAIDNLQIGGRNLLYYSRFDRKYPAGWAYSAVVSYTFDGNAATLTKAETTTRQLTTQASVSNGVVAANPNLLPENGCTYTISCEIMKIEGYDVGNGTKITNRYNYTDGTVKDFDVNVSGASETAWTKYSRTYTYASDKTVRYTQFIVALGAQACGIKIRNVKFEKGNKATDWTPAPEDVEASIATVETIATQTSDKFNWIVKSGTNETDFTLTDRTATLISDYINLNGLVTFSGLGSDTIDTIKGYSTAAIDGLKIGGRNLLPNTNDMSLYKKSATATVSVDSEGYSVITFAPQSTTKWYVVSLKPNIRYSKVRNKQVTISFEYRSDDWVLHNGEHDYPTVTFAVNNISETSEKRDKYVSVYEGVAPSTDWQKYEKTVTITDSYLKNGTAILTNDSWFFIQIFNHSMNHMQIRKIKLEIGNKATDWSPAPEDVNKNISEASIANWCYENDTTYINGGKIYTGTVTADKLSVTSLSAITADLGTVTAGTIQSNNYLESKGSEGMKLSLSDGSWDSANFKIDTTGNITATGGTLGGWDFDGKIMKKLLVNGTTDKEKRYVFINTKVTTGSWDGATLASPKGRVLGINSEINEHIDTQTTMGTAGALYINADGSISATSLDEKSTFRMSDGNIYLVQTKELAGQSESTYRCWMQGNVLTFCKLNDGKSPKNGYMYIGEVANEVTGSIGIKGKKGMFSDTEDLYIATGGKINLQANLITASAISAPSFTGVHTYNGNSSAWSFNNIKANFAKGTTPTATQYWDVNFLDANGTGHANRIGYIESKIDSAGTSTISLTAMKNETGGTSFSSLSIAVNTDGSETIKLGTKAIGNSYTPIYLNNGVVTKCSSMLPLTGGTMSGDVWNTRGSAINACFYARRTDLKFSKTNSDGTVTETDDRISFGINSRGARGIYDNRANKWLMYCPVSSTTTYINGNITRGAISTVTGTITTTTTISYKNDRNRVLLIVKDNSGSYSGFAVISISNNMTAISKTTLLNISSKNISYSVATNGTITITLSDTSLAGSKYVALFYSES